MEYSVAFVTSRVELQSLYWHLLKTRFWKRYLGAFLVMALALFPLLGPDISVTAGLAIATTLSAGVVLVFILLPLRSFKQEKRIVEANAEGLCMSVEDRSSCMQWNNIEIIEIIDRHICAFDDDQRTFFVPIRAFASNQEAIEFHNVLRSWRQQHQVMGPSLDNYPRDTRKNTFN